ncbi:MAG: hypothetical protein IT473_12970 [Lysobacter sp.]|nr:hypothetical protein [Lysobacter sp.]
MSVSRYSLAFAAFLFCVPGMASGMSGETREIVEYPHVASPERAAVIRADYAKIALGMPSAKVREILGEPDEIRPLYARTTKNPQTVGQTYWYVLRRRVAHGSQNERQESVVRVSFDAGGVVISVDAWGLDSPTR